VCGKPTDKYQERAKKKEACETGEEKCGENPPPAQWEGRRARRRDWRPGWQHPLALDPKTTMTGTRTEDE
jgi:hypothetical protein